MTAQTAKLYYTSNSPYARITRVAARQAGLIDQIEEIEALTRSHGTWYFDVTPLARVPFFVDGTLQLADTRDICVHFDQMTGTPRLFPRESASDRTYRQIATGFLDGIAVWLREARRPDGERSEPVMRYEAERAQKAIAWLEKNWSDPAPTTFTALTLACALDIARDRDFALVWDAIAPALTAWAADQATQPAMLATRPLAP